MEKKQVQVANISDQVMKRISVLTADNQLVLPKNYSAENALKSAWLVLQETTDRSDKPALQVCTKESIANAMFDMVLQGLSVSKKQGYFIVYGNKLTFQRSYFGTIALAKRVGGIVGEPRANVIYNDDEFVYEIDPKTAQVHILKHSQKVENIDDNKIKACYAVVTREDGTTETTIMTMEQIRKAWNQGATKGQSPAHKNFPAEMAKKTVIERACKLIVNSCSDAWLYEDKQYKQDIDKNVRDAEISTEDVVVTEASFVDVTEAPAEESAEPAEATKPEPTESQQADELPFGDEPNY